MIRFDRAFPLVMLLHAAAVVLVFTFQAAGFEAGFWFDGMEIAIAKQAHGGISLRVARGFRHGDWW